MFYWNMQGPFWLMSNNWLVGDPCLNFWQGVTCDKELRVIGLHFFENHMTGFMNASFAGLKYLKSLAIFNDGREFEQRPNLYMNTLWGFESGVIAELRDLEELNLAYLDMPGIIRNEFVEKLTKLRRLNLSYNRLSGGLPNIDNWVAMKDLRSIEL